MITTCAVCGGPVDPSRIQGFTGWEGPDGEMGREVTVVVHKECYMRLSPDERDALLESARASATTTTEARP